MFAAALLGADAYITLANLVFIFEDVPLRPMSPSAAQFLIITIRNTNSGTTWM
jgi:hypothetical protein